MSYPLRPLPNSSNVFKKVNFLGGFKSIKEFLRLTQSNLGLKRSIKGQKVSHVLVYYF